MNAGSRYDAASNTLTDLRDGKIYKTTKIGTMIFTAENMKIEIENSYCYENDSLNCVKYGRLYVWDAASKACPSGWHLPDSAEWGALLDEVGGEKIAGIKLKSADGWSNGGNGTDDFSFNALSAGRRYPDGMFFAQGILASFWGSTKKSNSYVNLYFWDNTDVGYIGYLPKEFGESVRCIKDRSYVPLPSTALGSQYNAYSNTLKDFRNDKTYKTVTIGSQIWMAENLNYSVDNSYCYENLPKYCTTYGRLYTWAAAMDSAGIFSEKSKGCGYGSACSPTFPVRGVCPRGWHLPDSAETALLIKTAGGNYSVGVSSGIIFGGGTYLKSSTGWSDGYYGHNGNGVSNSKYPFNALPAGFKHYYESGYDGFGGRGCSASFWTSTESNERNTYSFGFSCENNDTYFSESEKRTAFSIRCLKD